MLPYFFLEKLLARLISTLALSVKTECTLLAKAGRHIGKICVLCLVFITTHVYSATTYIPLQMQQLNKDILTLFMKANVASMQRPYAISHVRNVLETEAESQPLLISRIRRQLDKLSGTTVGYANVNVSISSQSDFVTIVPNQLAELSDSNGSGLITANHKLADWLSISYGAVANNSFADVNPYETYVSLGGDNFQLDIGYKQDWLSPFQTRSMLYSNNAKTTFSIGVKNPIPLKNWWDLQYNVFVKSLEKHDAISSNGGVISGTPYVLATQLSFQPLKGTAISLNRTFQFGGRGQSITFDQIWGAFSDAVGNDNRGLIPDCGDSALEQQNCEFGNQRASLSIKQNFSKFSIYGEMAGEDAASGDNLLLGDIAVSAGLSIPSIDYLDRTISLTYEITEHQSAWHRHGTYKKGYRVGDASIGQWGTNYTYGLEGASGLSQALIVGTRINDNAITLNYLFHRNKNSPNQSQLNYDYVDHHDLEINIEPNDSKLSYKVGLQRNVYNEFSLRGGISWQY